MGGCGSSLRKYGSVKSPSVRAPASSEGRPLVDARQNVEAHAKETGVATGSKAEPQALAAQSSESKESQADVRSQDAVEEGDAAQATKNGGDEEQELLTPLIDHAAKGSAEQEKQETSDAPDSVEVEAPIPEVQTALSSDLEATALDADITEVPEPETHAKHESDTWEALIERGEVRPDLSWHEAAAAGEVKTLEWLQSSRDAKELLDLRDPEKCTALHAAAQSGKQLVCEWLLRQQADPSAQNKTRGTPLHLAALGGHVETCRLLLDPAQLWSSKDDCPLASWPEVTVVDLWRRSPVFKAAEGGHVEVVKLLLAQKAVLDKNDREGESVLHKAAAGGHAEVIEALLDASRAGVSMDLTNSEGCSPLDLCVKNKQCEAGDLLVRKGAKLVKDVRKKPPTLLEAVKLGLPFLCTYLLKGAPDIGPNSWKKLLAELGEDGKTPLFMAVASESLLLVERLLEGRADVENIGPSGRRPVHEAAAKGCLPMLELLVEKQASLDAADSQGQNALFFAASHGQAPFCDWLLAHGFKVGAEDDREQTPLHMAAREGHVAVCSMLLDQANNEGADYAHDVLQASDWEGFEPVNLAIRFGHADTCKFLAERSADLHKPLDYGVTTLQMAAEHGHTEIVRYLIADLSKCEANGSKVVKDEMSKCRIADGRTAWLLAAAEGHLGCCQELWNVAETADIGTSVDRDGRDALLLAARNGHVNVCSWLQEIKPNPPGLAVVDACQWTPLHAAAAEGHRETVKWLLAAKADIGAVDDDGKSARDWAGMRGHMAIEALLRDADKTGGR